MNFNSKALWVFKWSVLVLGITDLSACSTVPKNLREAPESSPMISAVQKSPETYLQDTVRWGGSIVEISHANGETKVQIISRPLATNSRPSGRDQSDGRFVAVFDGFLEPEIYKDKRLLTVLGQLQGMETQKIGDLDYTFPVVRVQQHHLWQKENPSAYPYDRHNPWGFWNSPYPFYYYDGFYSSLWHRPQRPHRH